jgi:hypothetical protein
MLSVMMESFMLIVIMLGVAWGRLSHDAMTLSKMTISIRMTENDTQHNDTQCCVA